MSASLSRATASLRPVVRVAGTKEQPWKAFWPLKPENYSPAERAEMPWLTFKYDKANPNHRPWRSWVMQNQSTVVRRGVW